MQASTPPTHSRPPFWLWLHLMSLEAPLVSALWAAGLAKVIRVPLMPGVLWGLGLSVWMIYVLDRLLDTVGKRDADLDARHLFHRRHQRVFMIAVAVAAVITSWLAFWVVPADLMWHCVMLAVPMLFYLAIYTADGSGISFRWLLPLCGVATFSLIASAPLKTGFKLSLAVLVTSGLLLLTLKSNQERLRSAMNKDVVGGMLFALGCTAWSRFIRDGADTVGGFLEFVLLSCLFISNLAGISAVAGQSRWLAAGFGAVVGSLALVWRGDVAESMSALATACGLGFALLAALQLLRRHFSTELYRVLADVAVALPVMWLFIRA